MQSSFNYFYIMKLKISDIKLLLKKKSLSNVMKRLSYSLKLNAQGFLLFGNNLC